MTDTGTFAHCFQQLTGHAPFPWQRRLADGDWPDVLVVPTGLGKTAGVLCAWLVKRLAGDPDTPRRLIYCLPMRVLVEQVAAEAERYAAVSRTFFDASGLVSPRVHVLIGGASDDAWVDEPERPAIIVGTQDMLLSRALMRGYGISRYRWPVGFAFLHNDALWVFDEVQLMGAGLATSSQLEAFRRSMPLGAACRSLWLSATLRPDWLSTVDFRPHVVGLRTLRLDDDPADRDSDRPEVTKRLDAPKTFAPAASVLAPEPPKARWAAYAGGLAAEVVAAHRPETTTLVIVNRVDRAQSVFGALRSRKAPHPVLIHSRFRPAERRANEAVLRDKVPSEGRIVVATQAIEAGVDMTSATLFTELAPWASIVQRCGRCNRYGEAADGRVFWIDTGDWLAEHPELAKPYTPAALAEARGLALGHTSASPRLPAEVPGAPKVGPVLRRKDLIELFNTDPDLSGFDIDASAYIRDADDTDVHVFWRAFDGSPALDAARPDRDELCPVAIGRFRQFIGKRKGAFVWDPLAETKKDPPDPPWVPLDGDRLRPGLVIMLDAALGGYDSALGFVAESGTRVQPVPCDPQQQTPGGFDDERHSEIGRFVGLTRHLAHVEAKATALCETLSVGGESAAVIRAALWHDVGKAHPVFQNAIGPCVVSGRPRPPGLLAKSAGRLARYENPRFRHELASALAWLTRVDGDREEWDLVAYLIAAHHGKVRLGIRALPGEREPDNPRDGRRFARGVWEGDVLPAVDVGGRELLPETTLSLAVMELGEGANGESWAARTRKLLTRHGPFRLAWLEALVRIADWRASGEEQRARDDDL
jgi:CRISPR-associated endonuclease/helicase Cas3